MAQNVSTEGKPEGQAVGAYGRVWREVAGASGFWINMAGSGRSSGG